MVSQYNPLGTHRGRKLQKRSFAQAVSEAVRALYAAYREERHLRFHCLAGAAAAFWAWQVALPPTSAAVLALTIAAVIAAEVMNSAIERLLDLVTTEYFPEAGRVKELAAGAVLVMALGSLVVGAFLLLPTLPVLLSSILATGSDRYGGSWAFWLAVVLLVLLTYGLFLGGKQNEKGDAGDE